MYEGFEIPADAAACYSDGLSTAIIDSIAADTLADTLAGRALSVELPEPSSGVREGVVPMGLMPSYSNSSAMSALMIGTLLLVSLNAGIVGRALKAYRAELWSVRRRPNVFDDEQTVQPVIALILALVFVVFGGIVLYNLHGVPSPTTFTGAITSMALLGAYYIFQRCAYWLVGYTFTTSEGMRRWLGGFAATQAYTGLLLVTPAMLMVYRPQWLGVLLPLSLSIYFAARLLFVIKSFRIFYNKIWSSLYFILYLCTLEILPIVIIYHLSAMLEGIL